MEPSGSRVLDRDAFHQLLVEGVVARHQRRLVGHESAADRRPRCFGRQRRVETFECLPQTALKNHIAVAGIGALGGGFSGRNLRAVTEPS